MAVRMRLRREGKKKQPLKYPDWPADAPAADTTGWVHSIAIVDGHVCDFQTHTSLSALWLESNNQPQPRKGASISIYQSNGLCLPLVTVRWLKDSV